MKSLLLPLTLLLSLCLFSCDSTAKTKKKKAAPIATLIESHKQIIYPGRQEGDIIQEYAISLQWNTTQKPIAFWWRGDSGWMTCRVAPYPGRGLAHPNIEGNLNLEAINKGDKITVIPIAGGKYAIPAVVSESTTNTLYYQVQEGKYMPIKVTSFTYQKKVAMP